MVQGWEHATRRCTIVMSNSEFCGLQFFGVTGVSTCLAWIISLSISGCHHFGGTGKQLHLQLSSSFCCLFLSHISSLPSTTFAKVLFWFLPQDVIHVILVFDRILELQRYDDLQTFSIHQCCNPPASTDRHSPFGKSLKPLQLGGWRAQWM